MKLQRTLEQYANCTASGVAGGSKAQMMYFVEDAKKDIATLSSALAAKDAEIAVLRKALTGLRSYFLTHGWDEKSMMVENIDQALAGGSHA